MKCRSRTPLPAPNCCRLTVFAVVALTATGMAGEGASIRFDRDIRPILAENCFACHGPGGQEAGLRLDTAEAASRELDSGLRAVVPSDIAASGLVDRIRSSDADLVMPPPYSHKELSASEQELLVRWIEAGAPYEQHWSFRPLERPALPRTAESVAEHPVDAFLTTRLEADALPINLPADRPTLIRRLSFTLTGLPPTPAEVDAFLADPAADAYEKLVARLLASPRHGEEMARHWLDAARYGDTHGLHLDNERQMWAYRDWVVNAFNENLPFDQFTIEQVAGDLLPTATPAQQTATGFCRANVTTGEGGSIDQESLFRYAVDRTATVTQAWLGLTGQCAVCHDHKFDPISQREFYSLYAFFNSAADPGNDGNALTTAPAIPLPTAEQELELATLKGRGPELQNTYDELLAAVDYTDPASLDPRPEPVPRETVWIDDDFPSGAAIESGPSPTQWFVGTAAGEVLAGQRSLERSASGIGQDVYRGGAEPLTVPPGAQLFAHVWLDPDAPPRAIMLQFHTDNWNHRGVWGDASVIPWGDPGTPSQIAAGDLPPTGQWVRISIPAAALGLTPETRITGLALTQFDGHVRWDLVGHVASEDPASNPARSFTAWWGERVGREALDDVPADLRDLVRQGPEKTVATDAIARIRQHWIAKVWAGRPESLTTAEAAIEANRQAVQSLEAAFVRTTVFNDLPQMRESFVMVRGAYDKQGEKVERATPAFLPPLARREVDQTDRLDLARWLVSAEQPLTPRVAANRLWQQVFGTGLVKTSEDFGLQGEQPSHPELLDWLAAEYRASGWNTRHILQLLVTSAAFTRDATVQPEQLARDPENRLLARGPRIRLDAEQIRDNALAVSGLLSPTTGGRGTKPYQPDNIWEPVGFAGSNTQKYERDSGDALYRRSIYVFFKRTAPPPFMINFDAPNREQFCARRERSNTPLQSLQLMNDTQHVEAARALAVHTLAAASGDAGRIAVAFRTVLARFPRPEETLILARNLTAHRERYAADPAAATELIRQGDSPPPENLPPEELAAWTLVANLLLNLDETLTRN